MENVSLVFRREKETKNTVRFQEQPAEGRPPVIGTLYVQKWYAGQADELHVVISPAGRG